MLHQPGMWTSGGAHPACSAPLPPRTNINMQEMKAPLLVQFITPAPQFMDVLHAMSPPIAWMNRMLPMACFCHTEFVFLLGLHARQIALSWKRTKVPVGKLLPHGQASHWSGLHSRLFLPRLFDSKVHLIILWGKNMHTRQNKIWPPPATNAFAFGLSQLNVFQWIWAGGW